MTPHDDSIELFPAFTVEELEPRETALISIFYRGENCSGSVER